MSTRVAAVTGANRGIGRAITVALAAGGFTVAASARDPASLADTVEEAGTRAGRRSRSPATCGTRQSVAKMAAEAQALGPVRRGRRQRLSVAGPTLPLQEITLDDWRDTSPPILDGVFLTFRAFIPAMIERRGGSLIAISSMTGKRRCTAAPLRRGQDGRDRAGPHARHRARRPTTSGSTRSAPAPSPRTADGPGGPHGRPPSAGSPRSRPGPRSPSASPLGRMVEPPEVAQAVRVPRLGRLRRGHRRGT